MTWLGQKPEPEPIQPTRPSIPVTPQAAPRPVPEAPREKAAAPTGANIGKSIHVKGELSGSEDLAIEGKVDGKISLSGCRVIIGASGQVAAEIVAKSVVVGGQVKGDIRAEERVEIAATGTVVGDVRAPRVALVDGARFKGSIDMDPGAPGAKSVGTGPSVSYDQTPAYASASES